MLAKLWQRFREDRARQEQLKDGAAVERFVREHDEAEREKSQPPDLPPGRSNTDQAYVNWPR